jgi:hypothetical protein
MGARLGDALGSLVRRPIKCGVVTLLDLLPALRLHQVQVYYLFSASALSDTRAALLTPK